MPAHPAPAKPDLPAKKKQRTGDVAMASVVTIELKPGEKDTKNVAYHTLVLEAWDALP